MLGELVAPFIILNRTVHLVTDGADILWIKAICRVSHHLADTRTRGRNTRHPKCHGL